MPSPRFIPNVGQASLSREDAAKLDRLVRSRGAGMLSREWRTGIEVLWKLSSGGSCRKEVTERIAALVRSRGGE